MGAVKKMYDLLAVTTPRQSLEFLSQAQGLGTANEASSSLATQGVYISTTNQNVTINWGDGTEETFSLTANVSFAITGGTTGRKIYVSPFGNGVMKLIKVTFQNPLTIIRFDATNWWLRGNLSTAIDSLQNLVTLNLGNNYLDTIPANIANLTSLETLGLNGSPSLGGKIPDFVFLISSLKVLFFANNLNGLTYTQANFTRLSELGNLIEFTFGILGFSELPPPIFDAPSLVKITAISPNGSSSISPSIPASADARITWRYFNPTGCYREITTVNTFVDNLYTFITTNAAISGASSLPFRAFNLVMTAAVSVPTGIFQQPSGYSAGVSNGSPASVQEKLWVLVNQYAAIISIAGFTISGITAGAETQVTFTNINPGGAFVGVTQQHQLVVGSVVHFRNITGTIAASLNNLNHTISAISGNVITITTDTTGQSWTSGGNTYRV